MNEAGSRLRTLREGLHLSQKQIANMIECTQSAVYRYETGKAEPPIKTMLWYADYFDVSMDFIYGRTKNAQGKLYEYRPKIEENSAEMRQFVEMCFDPKVGATRSQLKRLSVEPKISRLKGTA